MTMVDCWTIKFQFEARRFSGKEALPMYAQKAIVHNAPTLHTVRNVHNAHCAYRFKVQSCDCINFVRAIERELRDRLLGNGKGENKR